VDFVVVLLYLALAILLFFVLLVIFLLIAKLRSPTCPKCKNALIDVGSWDGYKCGGAVLRCSKCAEIYLSSGKGLEVCNNEVMRYSFDPNQRKGAAMKGFKKK